MANGHGGYREPANPAPVSGPGALSQRTDGQGRMALPDAAYGEQKAFQDAQAGAPMAEATPVDLSNVVPLDAPSQRPDEPVTAGAPVGPGQNSLSIPSQEWERDMERVYQYLPALKMRASMPGASPATRQLVRLLEAGRRQRGLG